MTAKKNITNSKSSDKLKINASFDDVISLSVGKSIKSKNSKQQNVTPSKSKNK